MADLKSVYDVLRDVVDGLFRVGGVTDAAHAELTEAVNAADPAAAEAAKQAEVTLSDQEAAELERLLAKQDAAAKAAEAAPPAAVAEPGGGFAQAPAQPS